MCILTINDEIAFLICPGAKVDSKAPLQDNCKAMARVIIIGQL